MAYVFFYVVEMEPPLVFANESTGSGHRVVRPYRSLSSEPRMKASTTQSRTR